MNITYIKLFVDYLDAIEPLGDAERGRLFTALMQYARSGEAPQLNGNERFLFPMMRAQIDRDKKELDDLHKTKSAAGKVGGEASASRRKQTRQAQADASKSSKDNDKDKRQTTKDKRQTITDNAPLNPPAVSVIADEAAVFSAYLDKISPVASQTSMDELGAFVRELGASVCLRAFDMALDRKKATWPYIRGILRRLQAQGVKCLADWDEMEAKRNAGGDINRPIAQNHGKTRDGWKAERVDLDAD